MKSYFVFIAALFTPIITTTEASTNNSDNLPKVVSGKLIRHAEFESKYVAPRHVDVWIPEAPKNGERLPVLYMHDGRMLFDPSKSWNGQAWNIDDVATDLIQKGKLAPFLVVGIWNGGPSLRHREYFPQKAFANLSKEEAKAVLQGNRGHGDAPAFPGPPISDAYLRFLVEELKPFIDQNYPTLPERESTFIAGSSMGGLISMYALCEYPETFGAAACLSTHWPGIFSNENNPIPAALFQYLKNSLPPPDRVRVYFDLGDQDLDALYEPHQSQVDEILRSRNFNDTNWTSLRFPGTNHSENAWNARLHIPLLFLLGN